MSDETDETDETAADSERMHHGHRVVEMATERYNILLAMDKCDDWRVPRLKDALSDALSEINRALQRELRDSAARLDNDAKE